jgi:hypothetical protein
VGTWARLNKPIEVKPGFDPFHLLPAEGRRYDQRFRAVAIVKFGGAAVAVACGAAAVVGVNAREMEQVNASTASAHGFAVQFAWDVPVLVAFLLGVAAAVGILTAACSEVWRAGLLAPARVTDQKEGLVLRLASAAWVCVVLALFYGAVATFSSALAQPGYTASVLAIAPVVRWFFFVADTGAFLTLVVANGALRAAKRAELQRAKLQRPNRRAGLEGVTFLGFFFLGLVPLIYANPGAPDTLLMLTLRVPLG